MAAAAESGVFASPIFSREINTWLQRAQPDDKKRFERVFGTLRNGVDDSNAQGEQQQQSQGLGKPPPVPYTRAATPPGWTYTTTKAAQRLNPSRQLLRDNGRPSSADGQTGATEQEQQLQQTQQPHPRPISAPHNRELASLINAHKQRPGSPSGMSRKGVTARRRPRKDGYIDAGEHTNPNTSIYHTTYNAREEYPELYEKAIQFLRSEPTPNYTLISEWGDSLKAAVDTEWRKKFMKSMYTSANEQVIEPGSREEAELEAAKERCFFEWMMKQKIYYGDLLKQIPKGDMEGLFAEATTEKKKEILDSLRQVYAVVKPDDLKSHSQATHRLFAKTENPELTALMTEQIRIKTMGRPPPVVRTEDLPKPGEPVPPELAFGVSGGSLGSARPGTASRVDLTFDVVEGGAGRGVRPSSANGFCGSNGGRALSGPGSRSAGPSLGGAADPTRPLTTLAQRQTQQLNGDLPYRPQSAYSPHDRPQPSKQKKTAVIETHKSKVPLNWPGHMNLTATTAYKDAFGGPSLDVPRPASTAKQYQAIRIKEATCPIGSVNANTAIAAFRDAYPVPEGYVQRLQFPLPSEDNTIYRQDFYKRSDEDMVRSTHDMEIANEATRKASVKTSIPLGKNGYSTNSSAKWKSDYQGNFIGYVADIKADHERAKSLKAALSGPTAAAGALTASHMMPSSKRLQPARSASALA